MKEKISQIFGVPIGQENIGDTSTLLNPEIVDEIISKVSN